MKDISATDRELTDEISSLKQKIRELTRLESERACEEEELHKSRRFLLDLIEYSGALICVKDREGRYEMVNGKWEGVTGLKRGDTIGRTDEELFPGPTGRQFRLNDLEVIETGSVLEKEEVLEDGRGKRFFISIKFPLRGDDGGIRGVCGMFTEITARKEAEEELAVSKDRLARAEIISHSGNWEFDMSSNRVFASEGARRIYGLPGSEWTIPEIQKMPLPEYREMLDRALKGLIEDGRPYDVEFRIRRPDTGDMVDIHSVAEYDGRRKVVFGIIQDITKSKLAESQREAALEALKKSESLTRAVTDSAQDAILMMDTDGRISFWNKAAEHIFGYVKEEAIGMDLHRLLAPERFLETYHLAFERFKATGSGHSTDRMVELQALRKSGDEFPIELSLSAINLEDGWHAVGIIRDITTRRKAEEELRESRRRLEDIIEFLPDATFVIDREGKVIAWNRAIETITRVRKEDMLGKGDYEYAIPFYGKRRPILIDHVLHPNGEIEKNYTAVQWMGDVISAEAFAPNIPSGDFHVYATASGLHDSKGNVIAAIECIRDNSERKKLAERLNRAEKMEGLGRLAGGVAHDLNNVLGVLVGYSELLRESLPRDSLYWKYADNILRSGMRGAAIIQDLLTLARRGVAVSEVVNLNRIVADYLKTPEFEKLQSENREIKINVDLSEGLLNTRGSPVHLNKTLVNLVSNAAEALSGGGEITIRTENRYLDVPIHGYDSMKEGDYTVLTVSDTGKGIPERDMGKIFEPFYTNKVMGRSGTGLGLAVVWGTVKDHDGYIDVQSEEDRGSTFTIYLPVVREEATQRERAIDSAVYRGRGEKILVVDDVMEQRELAINMLKVLGYEAEALASGEEAIDYYMRGKRAELVVLDMIMEPGMDGLETFRGILEIHPGQKAVIVSGFSETDRVKKAQELGAGTFVRKPYVLEKIGLAVRKELDKDS